MFDFIKNLFQRKAEKVAAPTIKHPKKDDFDFTDKHQALQEPKDIVIYDFTTNPRTITRKKDQ